MYDAHSYHIMTASTTDNRIHLDDVDAWAESLIDRGGFDEISLALKRVSSQQIRSQPSLLRLQAHLAYYENDFDRAFPLIQEAQHLAIRQERWRVAVYCALDEARWWQAREKHDAAQLVLDVAGNLAERAEKDVGLHADLLLAVSWLLPDFSQNRRAMGLCQQALHLYEQTGDAPGQVRALWLLSVINTYMGRLTEARAQIERALRLHRLARLSPLIRLYLLNVSAHIYLYAGRPEAGLLVVREEAAALLRKHPHSKPALYLGMAEAGLLRQQGRYVEALAAYDRAEAIVEALQDEGYRPWLALQRGWIHLLMGESPAGVRAEMLQAGSLHYKVMERGRNMYLAVLDLLENRLDDVETRLAIASREFEASADLLELLGVRIYQAYLFDLQGRRGRLQRVLEEALGWAENGGIDFFPFYWHPRIVAHVCVTALHLGVRSRQAELMILRRLADVAASELIPLLSDASVDVRQRAQSVLAALGDEAFRMVLHGAPGPRLTGILLDHVQHGQLLVDRFGAACERLSGNRAHPDWTRLAVFGYYAGGDLPRPEMAQALALSESAVKKHIAAIRAAFGVRGRGGRDRGRALVQAQAKALGLVR